MARYDRIARLDPPDRAGAFPGWLTLRDLDGREREIELGRRARLRFMALRPVRRLLQRGLDGPASDSFERQIDAVRAELGQLPRRDPERRRLADYLKEIGGRTPRGLARATLDVGAAAEVGGHQYAAEEFYRTALDLALAYDLTDQRLVALRCLARLHQHRGEYQAAGDLLEQAAALADGTGHPLEWARALGDLAALRQAEDDQEGARALLARLAERGGQERDNRLIARAAAGRCRLALATGELETALEDGWNAVRLMEPSDEDRNAVLLDLAAALRRLGLHDAAASAYRIVGRWAAWPEHRLEARVEQAVVAAEGGSAADVRGLRQPLMESLDRSDPRLSAFVELGLGRATMLIGDVDDAREHLRTAIATARDSGLDDVLARAEEMLSALEDGFRTAEGARSTPPRVARAVADRVLELGRELVPSG